MSVEERAGTINCPHCRLVFPIGKAKRDQRARTRDRHVANSCTVLKWKRRQEQKKTEARNNELNKKPDNGGNSKFEQDEKILAHKGTAKESLARKFTKYVSPYHQLQIHYSTNKCKNYSEEEDRFMICKLHELGFGTPDVYELIRRAFLAARQFRRDWFIRSRTTQELSRLIQLVEKEYANEDKPEQPQKAQNRTTTVVENEISTKKPKN